MATTPLTITHIDHLAHISDQSLPPIIVHNAECIFNTNNKDLAKKIFDPKTGTLLAKIRKSQLNKVEELDPKYKSRYAHIRDNKTDKHEIIQDILLLGETLATKSPVTNLDDLVYALPKEADDIDTLDLSDPTILKNILKNLLITTTEQKQEIGVLKNDRDALSNEIAILKARLGLDDQNTEVSVQADNIPPMSDDLPVAEYSDPQETEPRPVRGAIKTTKVFIGGIDPPCTATDMLNHIKSHTTVTPKMSDINKLETRGENLAFKVTVPKNKFNEVISIWDEGITAELFNPQKLKTRTPRGARSNGKNKYANNIQSSRKQNSHSHRPTRHNYQSNYWSTSKEAVVLLCLRWVNLGS